MAPCKHKKAITKYYGIAQFSVLPECDAGARGMYHFLATGNHLDERWYRDINQVDQVPNVAEYVNQHLDNVTQVCDDNIPEPSSNENIENSDMSVDDGDLEESEEELDSNVVCEQKIEEFKSVFNNEFCNFVADNWQDKSVQKCFEVFTKKVASSVQGGVEKFKRYCYGFGKELSTKQKNGKKKKNGKTIPVQPTAVSRRTFRHRGRSAAVSGRKPKPARNVSQVFITDQDDGGALYHSQPVPNKRQKRGGHNLAADVANNQPGVTRH